MQHLTNDKINRYKKELVKLGHMTEQDIQNIWIKSGEEKTTDLSIIEYHWNSPLYYKMIFRLRNCERSGPRFFRQIDPCNQRVMLDYFSLFSRECSEILEFFAWIANGLGSYNITMLEFNDYNEELIEKSNYVKLWKENQIDFFFELPDLLKNKLIDQYNKDCVDSYNEMMDVAEMKSILMQTSMRYPTLKVNKAGGVLFSELSVNGGITNSYQAVQAILGM